MASHYVMLAKKYHHELKEQEIECDKKQEGAKLEMAQKGKVAMSNLCMVKSGVSYLLARSAHARRSIAPFRSSLFVSGRHGRRT